MMKTLWSRTWGHLTVALEWKRADKWLGVYGPAEEATGRHWWICFPLPFLPWHIHWHPQWTGDAVRVAPTLPSTERLYRGIAELDRRDTEADGPARWIPGPSADEFHLDDLDEVMTKVLERRQRNPGPVRRIAPGEHPPVEDRAGNFPGFDSLDLGLRAEHPYAQDDRDKAFWESLRRSLESQEARQAMLERLIYAIHRDAGETDGLGPDMSNGVLFEAMELAGVPFARVDDEYADNDEYSYRIDRAWLTKMRERVGY